MRTWLLTNTTYGTWLPGNPRGSITSVRDRRPSDYTGTARVEHDVPGEPWEDEIPGLYCSAVRLLKGDPILFDLTQAEALLEQFQETARYRKWILLAAAIMHNHFHMVVRVTGDPEPKKVLATFKAYGTRKLNELFGKPLSDTWWTTNGSKRKLKDARAVEDAINYVLLTQPQPLVVWSAERGRIV